MAYVQKDRVKETSTTTGTGTYTLAGAATGFQAFSVIGDGNTCCYAAEDGTDWEVGIGTYTLSGTTLARTTILASSNSGSAVNWSSGTRNIFCTLPADRAVQRDEPEIRKPSIMSSDGLYELLQFNETSGAVNEITIANALTTQSPELQATGGDVNIDLNLVPKGSGVLKADSVDVVTTTGTQTLSNKTLSGFFMAPSSSEPGSPSANQIYLDDGTNSSSGTYQFRIYDSGQWNDIGTF